MRRTLKQILIEYGAVGVVLYLVIFFLVLGGAWLAMETGFRPASVGSQTGTFVAAYIVTKLTQPLRIAATVLLTPLVARIYERVTGRSRSTNGPVDG
jgi:NADH:ubiquinone oxidoreductase subunit 6 (subunit J)